MCLAPFRLEGRYFYSQKSIKGKNHALRFTQDYDRIYLSDLLLGGIVMDIAVYIRELRESTGMTRKDYSLYTGIPVRTLEDWEAGRRTPPDYLPRLLAYQLRYEELLKEKGESVDDEPPHTRDFSRELGDFSCIL